MGKGRRAIGNFFKMTLTKRVSEIQGLQGETDKYTLLRFNAGSQISPSKAGIV